MSCPTATAPIDISISNITGNCLLKCSYSFHYNNSSCVATNRGDYITMSYDKSSSSQATYNTLDYYVQEIRLYNPSLHSFLGKKTDAELVIVHQSNTGANPLLVCIPVRGNNTSSTSAALFQTLIDTVASSAPVDGESCTVIFSSSFNLSNLVPKKPYFSYSASEPYQPCSQNVEYIVFKDNLDMTPETLKKFQSIIRANPYDVKQGPSLFYNEKGPNLTSSDDGEIYIDCSPVGESDEEVPIVVNLIEPGSWGDLGPVIKVLLGALFFFGFLYLVRYMLGFLGRNKKGASSSIAIDLSTFDNKA